MSIQFNSNLKIGMSGEDVRELQQALASLGYTIGPIDGIFGPRTQSAVIAFQRNFGLAQDGIVGPVTTAALNRALTEPVVLKLGSRGPEVGKIQSVLKDLGYDPGPIDGVFGPLTQAAVIAFQKDYGLKQDGVVGPITLNALDYAVRRKTTSDGVLSTVKSLVNAPFTPGGHHPDMGFDCAGLVVYVYSCFGINLPRTSRELIQVGISIPYPALLPGDLVFFDINGPGLIDHVGIYIGNDTFISVLPDKGVVEYTFSAFWQERFQGARRVY